MSEAQSALELCDDETEQAAAANGGRRPAADVPLGKTTKQSIVARQPASGALVVVGSVINDESAEKLRRDAVAAGLVNVQVVHEWSARDFRLAVGKKP